MSTPIIESIAENIKDTINLITVANGFNQTLTAIRPKRNDFAKTGWDDLTVLISQVDAEELKGGYGCKEWRQNFTLSCIVIDSDTATASIDTRLNQVASDIFKKLMVDTRRGALAIDTNIHGMLAFVDAQTAMSGILIDISVDYRTSESDPYTQM